MTKLLQEVIEKASKLPEKEQDALAAMWLKELEDERRWSEAFANSQDKLGKLAEQVRKEYNEGKTEPFDVD